MRIMFFSSMLININHYAKAFSKFGHEFFMVPLISSGKRSEYEKSRSMFKDVGSPNVRFCPVYLSSPNEGLSNLANPIILLSDFRSIFEAIRSVKPDVVIVMYLSQAYPFILLRKFLGYDVYTIAVGSDVLEDKGALQGLLRRVVYRGSRSIFAVSHELEEEILGGGGRNVLVLPTGVDPAFLRPLGSKIELREKWGFQGEDFIILTLSQLVKVKSLDDVLRATCLVKKDSSAPVKLIMAGDGPERRTLEDLALKLGISDDVLFPGFVDETEKLELFNIADVYVLASLREGLPFSLLEAMACGCVCVSTPVGGIPRVIDGETNGFLADVGDYRDLAEKIGKAISLPPEESSSIRDGARRTIEADYDFAKLTEKMMKIIESQRCQGVM